MEVCVRYGESGDGRRQIGKEAEAEARREYKGKEAKSWKGRAKS